MSLVGGYDAINHILPQLDITARRLVHRAVGLYFTLSDKICYPK